MTDSAAGYGKPPKHSQFKPGQSGNKKGRPRGRLSLAHMIEKHLAAKVTVNIGGRSKKVSRREALVLSLVGDALKGKDRVRKQLLDLVLMMDAQMQAEATPAVSKEADKSVLESLLYSYGIKSGDDKAPDENA